jgi:hypothetical protein
MEFFIIYGIFGFIFLVTLCLMHGVLKWLDKKGIIDIDKIIKDLDKNED